MLLAEPSALLFAYLAYLAGKTFCISLRPQWYQLSSVSVSYRLSLVRSLHPSGTLLNVEHMRWHSVWVGGLADWLTGWNCRPYACIRLAVIFFLLDAAARRCIFWFINVCSYVYHITYRFDVPDKNGFDLGARARQYTSHFYFISYACMRFFFLSLLIEYNGNNSNNNNMFIGIGIRMRIRCRTSWVYCICTDDEAEMAGAGKAIATQNLHSHRRRCRRRCRCGVWNFCWRTRSHMFTDLYLT